MIQVYTGNGKGKTTAALGLAIRAAGAGKKVFIGQFIKGKLYSELKTLKKIKDIRVEQFGRGCFIRRRPDKKDIEAAQKGLEKVKKFVLGKFDVVILDEINIAIKLGLLKTGEVLKFIRRAPKKIELILTGRNAPAEILKVADLVSEIKEIKHYYKKGLKARRGIEF